MSFSKVLLGAAMGMVSSVAVGQQSVSSQAQWEAQAVGGQLVLGGQVQTTGSFQSDLPAFIHTLLQLNVAPDTAVHLGGDIANTATSIQGILKLGQGDLLLSGSNTYLGGTELRQGSLWLGSNQALGATTASFDAYLGTRLVYMPGVTIGNTLQLIHQHYPFGSQPAGPYANSLQWQVDQGVATHQGSMVLDGVTNIVKQGSGILRLTGNTPESYARFQVNQGGLAVDGILLGSAQVHMGAWLQGQGFLGDATIGTGGVLFKSVGAPALRIQRNLTFHPGAVFVVDVSAAGAGEPIHVQGQASLAGALQAHTADDMATSWPAAWEYPVLKADAGFGDTRFDSVSVNVPFLTPSLRYDAQQVYLNLGLNRQAASIWPFSGAWDASVVSGLTEDSRYLRQSALRHLAWAPSAGPFLWADTYYADAERSANKGNPGDQRSVSGLVLGLQQPWGKSGQWNAFVGMQETRMRLDSSMAAVTNDPFSPSLHTAASANVSSLSAGLSAAWQAHNMTLSVGAAHTWHRLRNHRRLALGGLTDALSSRYSARTTQVFGELAVNGTHFTPYAGLAWVQTQTQGHTENGGPAALALNAKRHHVVLSTLGIRAQHTIETTTGMARIHGELAWRHAAGTIKPASHQQFAGAPALGEFMSYGLPISRHAIQLQAGVSAQLSPKTTLRMAYAGQYGRGSQEHGVQLGLTVAF
ncbi:autotransporter domain-containing protein [Alcaligenaceae bacterium]|nr:autotransporter domain-containing protein [Alcaligenaceae bacterium]